MLYIYICKIPSLSDFLVIVLCLKSKQIKYTDQSFKLFRVQMKLP